MDGERTAFAGCALDLDLSIVRGGQATRPAHSPSSCGTTKPGAYVRKRPSSRSRTGVQAGRVTQVPHPGSPRTPSFPGTRPQNVPVIPVEPSHPAPSSFVRSGETGRAGSSPPRASISGSETDEPGEASPSSQPIGRRRSQWALPDREASAASASIEASSTPGVEHQLGAERLAFLEREVRRLRREMDRLLRLMALLEHDLAAERLMSLKPGPLASVVTRVKRVLSWMCG